MLVTPSSMVMLVRLEPEKAPPPMLVTLFGMVILVKPVQYAKASLSMLVTPLSMVILFRLEQPEKA